MDKACSVCSRRRPYSDFYPKKAGADGLTAACRPCTNAQMKAYRKRNAATLAIKAALFRDRNREELAAKSRAWARANPEYVKQNCRSYAERNRDHRKAYNAAWQKANADALRPYHAEKSRRRFARQLKASPAWANPVAILAIYERCRDISLETGVKHHVDHVIPLVSPLVCGLHVEYNLQILPAAENLSKSNRFEPETF